jgi:hypothetical protein
MLALLAPGKAAQTASVQDGSVPPPFPTERMAPAPACAARPSAPGARLKPSPLLARRIFLSLPAWSPTPAMTVKRLSAPDPDVVEMAPLIVWGTRAKLTEADVLTDQGKLDLAEKTYISPLYRVTFGPLSQIAAYYFNFLSILHGWHPNEAEAMTLYRQDERLKMLGEMDSLIRLESIGGREEDAKELQRLRFEASAVSR